MAKFKNEAGEEVEAFTQDELDAKIKDAATAAAAKAVEDSKTANPAKSAEQIAAEKKAAEERAVKDAEPLTKLTKDFEALQATLRAREVADFAKTYGGADKAKQDEFKTAFGRLTGFESTPEGLTQQAEAAARMIGIDPAGVDISGVTSTGGNRNIDVSKTPAATEADKVVQKALGISAEDVKKYGPEAQKEADKK